MVAHKKLHDILDLADHDFSSLANDEVVGKEGGVPVGKAWTPTATGNTLIERDASGNASAADPTLSTHIATKNYVDNAISGLDILADVDDVVADASTTGPGTGLPAAISGQRYILETGTGALEAGWGAIAGVGDDDIVEYDGATWNVVFDASDPANEGALVWDKDSDQFFLWDGTTWAPFGGLAGVTAGDGVEKTGSKLEASNSVAAVAQQHGGLVKNRTADGSAVAAADAGHLAIKTDDVTLEINSSNEVQIKSSSPLGSFKGFLTYAGSEPVFTGELALLTAINDWAFFIKTSASTFLVYRRSASGGDATDFDGVEMTTF